MIAKSEVKSNGSTRSGNKTRGHRSQGNSAHKRSPLFR